jgi:hypothetical protein
VFHPGGIFVRLRFGVLAACLAILLTSVCTFAQTTTFQYVFPKITATAGSQLTISNLSARPATAQVDFLDSSKAASQRSFVDLPAGTQKRVDVPFEGTAIISSTLPLSAMATVTDSTGNAETLEPATAGSSLVIPFGQGTSGDADISVFNPSFVNVGFIMAAISPSGETLGLAQRSVLPLGTHRETVASFLPPPQIGVTRDVAYVVIRSTTNVLSGSRNLYAAGIVRDFVSTSLGVSRPRTDIGASNAIPVEAASTSRTLPFFVSGGNFFSIVEVVNTSSSPTSVSLTARASDGSAIAGTNPATVQLPPNGVIRMNAVTLFSFSSAFTMGSIGIQASNAVIAVVGIGSISQGSFAIVPSTPSATNFAYSIKAPTSDSFTGLSLLNLSDTSTAVTLRVLKDDGTAVSQANIVIDSQTSFTRTLAEILPEAHDPGLVYVTSEVPIVITAFSGTNSGSTLSNLVAMHSQSDYQPPAQTKFLATGIVRHNGAPLAGASVLLTGPASLTVTTDAAGTFVFPDLAPGTYTVKPSALGYTFTPAQIIFVISQQNSRNNDFAGQLIVPAISSVTPAGVVAGSSATEIVVAGGPFTPASQVVLDGTALSTTLSTLTVTVGGGTAVTTSSGTGTSGTTTTVSASTSATQTTLTVPVLRATLTAADLAVPRTAVLLVRTTGPGGSVSSTSRTFTVGNPAPIITGLSDIPNPLIAGNAGFTLKVTAASFMPGVSVSVGGIPHAATVVDGTTLQVALTQQDLAVGGNLKIEAFNPAPTIGPSNSLTLSVLNPMPGLISIFPTTAEARLEVNALPLSLTVNGFGFRADAQVVLGTTAVPTQFVSSSQLTAQIPAILLRTGGALQISVKNPDPSISTSEALPLFVNNLPPVLTSIDAGALRFDPSRPAETYTAPVVVHGSNFGPTTFFDFFFPCESAFVPLSGTTVSPQQVIFPVPIKCAGTFLVRAKTPQPGGGTSNVLSFDVLSASTVSAPVITSLSPASVSANSPTFTMTITGSGFETGAFVSFGSAVLIPSTVTATSITVIVPGFLLRDGGPIPVLITNPSSTGSSNRLLFNSLLSTRPPGATGFIGSGMIRHNGVIFPGITVQLTGPSTGTATTDITGAYTFPNLPNGTYTATPTAGGYTFVPTSATFTIANADSRTNDFAATLVAPTITSVTPPAAVARSSGAEIAVAGGPFAPSSQVILDGTPLNTLLGSMTVTVGSGSGLVLPTITIPVLRAAITPDLLLTARVATLTLRTIGPGATVTSAAGTSFVIGNAAPVLTSLSGMPLALTMGNSGFTLTVAGTGFMPGVSVTVGGVARTTTLAADGTLRVDVLQSDLVSPGNVKIQAFNPSPTIGGSNQLSLAVSSPTPGLTSISPTSMEVRLETNASPAALTVNGFGFLQNATVLVAGTQVPTTYVSSIQLTAQVPASLLQLGGSVRVTVKNPDPTLGTSEGLPLLLLNLPPILLSLDSAPLTYDPSRAAIPETFVAQIVLHGANISSQTVVEVATPCSGVGAFATGAAERVSTQQVIFSLNIACAGTYFVRLRTPQPAGGISAVLSIVVAAAGQTTAPTITSLSPSTVTANSGTFTLTVTGTGFVSGAFVNFGSAILVPSAVSSTSITVTVPNFLIPSAGLIPVIVTNSTPNGSSNRVLLTVN